MSGVKGLTHAWRELLTGLLAACLILVAASGSPLVTAWGVVAGLLIAGSPWIAALSHRAAVAALVIGAVPFAAFSWWTIVTPLIAVLVVPTGLNAIRHTRLLSGDHHGDALRRRTREVRGGGFHHHADQRLGT